MESETGECFEVIPIRNLYYMLSYAFKILQEAGYKKLATEEFQNAADLCAAILIKGVSSLLRRGLGRSYIQQTDSLSSPCGKIDVTDSIKTQVIWKRQLVCSYDEFRADILLNRILKSTMRLLLSADIQKSRKKELRRLITFFGDVGEIDLRFVNWNMRFDRNNQTYRMLMSICQLVCKGLLQRTEEGNLLIMNFFDEQRMCRLYEKFLLEYYRKEHPELTARAARIPWQLDDEADDLLPVMQTDVFLSDRSGSNVLIIDAKYYEHSLQTQFNAQTLHSNNLYQIFTYVKNEERALSGRPHKVSGLLLYAKTDGDVVPNRRYSMGGNTIGVRSLDLSMEFEGIREQLDSIAFEFFA